jgi:thiol-disulfide isomerase/thioredoxin
LRLLAIIGTLVVCAAGCASKRATDPADVMLKTLDGAEVHLANYRGQVVLVNFWATWCGPCQEEMPLLDRYYQADRADRFVLLAVNAGEPADRVRAYIAEGGYTFPVLLDEDSLAADTFGGIRGMPASFVLDADGELVYQHVGALTGEVLEAHVTSLLSPE